jgi:FkbM family methyltransferase
MFRKLLDRGAHYRAMLNVLGIWQALRVVRAQCLGDRAPLSLQVRGAKSPLLCRAGDSDFFVLKQVFLDRECELPWLKSARRILDVGAYAGYTAAYFAEHCPDATIVAVEPDPSNYELLCANTSAYPQVVPVRAAVWPDEAELCLQYDLPLSWGRHVGPGKGTDRVQGVTITQLMRAHGFTSIDIMKMDIEGAEREVFSANVGDWIERIGCLLIETHGDLASELVNRVMQRFGFEGTRHGEKCVYMNPRYEQSNR